ncbi:glycosyltransferase family 2 protein [Vibrio sp. Vb2131]|uniref:glycosyltransferase family 2 protein n=1 Tax=Vibrio sp. Vb2131 TaxID=3074649 RepID=UPI0029648154|nr:glycosyltransferase [Vibrio sp. Vb2131]MDW1886840.1 glycosyltransferase [Vibrio sp. Vb2131]
MKTVAIIIPTYRDWDRLRLCLNSIDRMSYPKENISVFVVNNDVDSNCPFPLPNNVVLLEEPKPGSYSARNKALEQVKNNFNYIAFTDSDCIVDENWLTNAIELFDSNSHVSRIGGRIDIFPQGEKVNTFLLIYEKAFAFDQRYYTTRQNMAATANLVVRSEVFDSVGGFNEKLLSGGDSEWGQRAAACGFNIMYADNVVIHHPSRGSFSEIIVKTRRESAGHLRKNGKKEFFNTLLGFAPPIKSGVRLCGNSSLTCFEKCIAFFIRYYLRLISTFEKIFVGLFNKSEERR